MSIFFAKLGKFSFIIFSNAFNFLLFLFFWHPYDANVGMFDVVSEDPYPILVVFITPYYTDRETEAQKVEMLMQH